MELALIAVATVGICVVSSARPTGVAWLDWLDRGAVGLVMVLAGSRARRWALVVAPAVVAAGSVGLALLAGVVGVVLALGLIGRGSRDRVVGGLIGGLVAGAAFHLDVSFFFGARTIVGALACLPLLFSGYRRTSRVVRRRWRVAILATGVAAVVLTVIATVVVLATLSRLKQGVDATRSAVSAAQDGQDVEAARDFEVASRALQDAADRTTPAWMSLVRVVPVVGQNLAVIQQVSTSGADLARVGGRLARQVDYERLQLPGGGIDAHLLASFGEPVTDALRTLNQADHDAAEVSSRWNVGPLETRLETFRSKVASLRHQTALASLAVQRAPAMLGVGAPRHYLVLLGDPSEARDLGGHLGNWAELTADGGHLTLDRVGVPGDLSLSSDPGASSLLDGFPPSLVTMKPLAFPQNWGANPDLRIVERLAATLFERKTGQHIDGAMYADPTAFADFLAITGPISVPGLSAPVTSANAVEFLTSTQFTAFPTEAAADAATTQLVHDVFARLTTSKLPGPKELSKLFSRAVHQGRFKFASSVDQDRPLLADLGLDGALIVPEGGDVLGVVNRNANPSKIDAYLHRSTSVDISWDPTTGRVHEAVAVSLRNVAPAAGPTLVVGNGAGLPTGTNLTDLAVLTSYQLERVEVGGVESPSDPIYDGAYWRDTVRVAIPPGQSVTVRFELSGAVAPSPTYRVLVVGQPLVNEGSITVRVRPTKGHIVAGRGLSVTSRGASLTVGDGADTQVALRSDP